MARRRIEKDSIDERIKYISAFNDTMVKIWKEKIELLDVKDTGQLLSSVVPLSLKTDAEFLNVSLSQEFLEYGVWQNYGTGKETPRGNGGDIGRVKKRVAKPWYFKKYYGSAMNIREFLADNLGQQWCYICSECFDDVSWRHKLWK